MKKSNINESFPNFNLEKSVNKTKKAKQKKLEIFHNFDFYQTEKKTKEKISKTENTKDKILLNKEELKYILENIDKLFEYLPEEKLKEFINSNLYSKYNKLLEKLEI